MYELVNTHGVVSVVMNIVGAHIYGQDGQLNPKYSNQLLGAGTKWKTDMGYLVDGQWYYRVGTDMFLRDDEVSFSFE